MGPLGDRRVTLSFAEMVSASLPDGRPQEGQNRASCGISAAQSTQRTMGILRETGVAAYS